MNANPPFLRLKVEGMVRWIFALILWLPLFAFANQGTVGLRVFPDAAVADGRSTIVVTAEVRDDRGQPAPDGTQVLFETSLGSFREPTVATRNGLAQGTLVSGSVTGFATVRVSAPRLNATQTVEVEFVGSRAELDQRNDVIEIDGKGVLLYSVEARIVEGSAASGERVTVRYEGVTVEADEVQVNVPTYEVRARRGVLRWGDQEQVFNDLVLDLKRMRGAGQGPIRTSRIEMRVSGLLAVPVRRERTLVRPFEVTRTGVTERDRALEEHEKKFYTMVDSIGIVRSQRVVAYPSREVQFTRADVRIQGQTVLRLPLYVLSVFQTNPIVTEQYVQVTNNQFTVDYPYYLSLEPGRTSLLRFRYGNRFGTGVGATGGTYLDYEFSWNQASSQEGALRISGIGRNDMGFGVRQSLRPTDRMQVGLQLDVPGGRTILGNANVNNWFNGWSLSLNGNVSQTLRGASFRSTIGTLVAELDPYRWAGTPLRTSLGLSATSSTFSGTVNQTRDTYGIRARTILPTLRLGRSSSFSASHQMELRRSSVNDAPTVQTVTLNFATQPNSSLGLNAILEYSDDPFTARVLGRTRLTLDSSYRFGRFFANAYLTRGLDVNRLSLSTSALYELGPLWRLRWNGFEDRFLDTRYTDNSMILTYQLGLREIGLSYSGRTRRFGFELLSAPVN